MINDEHKKHRTKVLAEVVKLYGQFSVNGDIETGVFVQGLVQFIAIISASTPYPQFSIDTVLKSLKDNFDEYMKDPPKNLWETP